MQENTEDKEKEIKDLDEISETEQATQQNPLSSIMNPRLQKWKKTKISEINAKYEKKRHDIDDEYQIELASEQNKFDEELKKTELDKKHDLALFQKMESLGNQIQKYAVTQLIARNRSFFISGCIGRLAENLKYEMTPSNQAINKLQKDYPYLWKTIQNINKTKAADLNQEIIAGLLAYQPSRSSTEQDEDKWIEHFNTILEAILNNKSEHSSAESLEILLSFDSEDQHTISFLLHALTQTQQYKKPIDQIN